MLKLAVRMIKCIKIMQIVCLCLQISTNVHQMVDTDYAIKTVLIPMDRSIAVVRLDILKVAICAMVRMIILSLKLLEYRIKS